jgi:regulator of protease activity HflC (stomatin/prohibitin superfamily)
MRSYDNDDDKTNGDRSPPMRVGGLPVKGLALGVLILIAVIVAFVFVAAGLRTVDSTERAVVFHRDGHLSILEPGKFLWVTPVVNSVTIYDVRSVAFSAAAEGLAKDQQVVTTEVTVLYHPKVDAIQTIHQTLGTDYETKIVVPAVQDSVKSAVNFYTAEELRGATRDQVRSDIINRITDAVEEQNLVVDQISLTDFDFSASYNQAIEEAAIAERKVQEAEANFHRAQIDANTTIVTAAAQAEAQRLLAANPSDVFFSLKWLDKWDGHTPLTIAGDANGLFITPQAPAKP